MVTLLPSQSERVPSLSSSGPASLIRGWHALALKSSGRGVIGHKVPRDTDTPDDT
jgi:hypothetical protein